jgi:nucleoside-diphosphate-sugar epimerase
VRILITGGTGFLGRRTAALALARGHQVRLLGRDFGAVGEALAAGAEAHRADLRDPAAIRRACAGMDAVIHAGALSAPWGPRTDFFAVNVGGTAAVIAGCRAGGIGRLVYVSSPSVTFAGRDVRNETEAAPYPRRFASVYSLTKKLGEDQVNAAARQNLATTIIRPKAIFGPGDRALLPRLLDATRRGRLIRVGDGRNRVDLTYVDNVAHAMLLALDAPAAVGQVYTITNDAHPRLWDTIGDVLRGLGLPAAPRPVPLPAALAVARIMEARARLGGGEPLLTRYSAAILARTQTYDIAAARRDLGYAPIIPLEEGIARTIAALKRPPPSTTGA